MKKLFAAIILLCLLSSGAFAAAKFRDFPAQGVCTGDYVRYRTDPDTDADIVGRLFKGDRVTVLSQTSVYGEIWYEIEDPEDEDSTVWVYGDYIRPRRR
ncbi:MAG: SH3 domain-containing protein [Synergistaceae bacterium]|nr:SH3 domain-containing protein [Synergistaceae bacterium]MBQ9403358.1 SH3 domain-containing protein [Synergistaceae bacterium]MBQ9596363.1 SH3 domain-containing protein [Synergistaceae bacterium]MBR0204984.1 SH3 domain-containing protein [Synergistaceae bacterium]